MAKRLTKKECYEAMHADYTRFYRPMPEAWKKLFPVVTVDILKKMGLSFTTKHDGKMTGMCSLSTTCKTNRICRARIERAFRLVVPGFDLETASPDDVKQARELLSAYIRENPESQDVCICGFCFSDRQQDYQTSMIDPLDHNAEILNNGIIHSDWLPVLNNLFFRGESFGDFASVNAVVNVSNLARKNPGAKVVPWSKNIPFFREAFREYGKPANMRLIKSSEYINKIDEIRPDEIGTVDAVFTVVTEEYAKAHRIKINCGARACLACLRCYTDGKQIFEALK